MEIGNKSKEKAEVFDDVEHVIDFAQKQSEMLYQPIIFVPHLQFSLISMKNLAGCGLHTAFANRLQCPTKQSMTSIYCSTYWRFTALLRPKFSVNFECLHSWYSAVYAWSLWLNFSSMHKAQTHLIADLHNSLHRKEYKGTLISKILRSVPNQF